MNKPPVIIIGMHRSGTTLLSKVLEESGLFLGITKDINNESLFFLKLNAWLMNQVSSSWDNPTSMLDLSDNHIVYLSNICLQKTENISFIKYLGFKRYFKSLFDSKHLNNWGWKDPRNTFTLPIWRKIFPKSKVIHIYRHPADVANSLKVRAEKVDFFGSNESLAKKMKIFFMSGRLSGYNSLSVLNLNNGYKLWKTYVNQAFSYKDVLHVKYEDLLESPIVVLRRIFDHLNIDVENHDLDNYSSRFNKDRAYAFLANEKLKAFFKDVENDDLVKELKYDIESIDINDYS